MDNNLLKWWNGLTDIILNKENFKKETDAIDTELAVKGIEQEYHGVNYETGHDDGYDAGFDACLEEGPDCEDLFQTIEQVCLECDKKHEGTRPGMLCEVERCQVFRIWQAWQGTIDK